MKNTLIVVVSFVEVGEISGLDLLHVLLEHVEFENIYPYTRRNILRLSLSHINR